MGAVLQAKITLVLAAVVPKYFTLKV